MKNGALSTTLIAFFLLGCLRVTPALTFSSNFESVKIEANPGQVISRHFRLVLTQDDNKTFFKARTEDWWRSEDGKQSFYREPGSPGAPSRSCAKWVKLNPMEMGVEPGGTLDVRLSVSVPNDVKPGGYWCVLTVDEVPDPLASSTGIGVRFNASVSVGVFVYVQPLARVARIVRVDVLPDHASIKIRNEGNTPLGVEGRFEFIRPGQKEPTASVIITRDTVLPEPINTIVCTSKLPDATVLPSGRYLVRAILDIGLDHYIGVQKEMEVRREVATTSTNK